MPAFAGDWRRSIRSFPTASTGAKGPLSSGRRQRRRIAAHWGVFAGTTYRAAQIARSRAAGGAAPKSVELRAPRASASALMAERKRSEWRIFRSSGFDRRNADRSPKDRHPSLVRSKANFARALRSASRPDPLFGGKTGRPASKTEREGRFVRARRPSSARCQCRQRVQPSCPCGDAGPKSARSALAKSTASRCRPFADVRRRMSIIACGAPISASRSSAAHVRSKASTASASRFRAGRPARPKPVSSAM